MYAKNLGPGMQLNPVPPSQGPMLMYSDQYVANRMRQTNLYAYANNNPVNAIDPSGEVPVIIILIPLIPLPFFFGCGAPLHHQPHRRRHVRRVHLETIACRHPLRLPE